MISINLFRILLVVSICMIVFWTFENPESVKISKRAPATSFKTLVYWGQNKIGINQYPGNSARQEPSLSKLCSTTAHDIIVIGFIKDHFSIKDMPAMDLSTHCKTPFYAESNQDQAYRNGQKLVLLNCPNIGADIIKCQQSGKKVLLGLSPYAGLDTDKISKAANNIWNSFLGGSGDRPFGSAVLDGVDFYLRSLAGPVYTDLAKELRKKITNDRSKSYYMIASPRCTFPDSLLGPTWHGLPLTADSDLFDHVNVHFMSSPDCAYSNEQFFYSTLKKWSDWAGTVNTKIIVTLPAWQGFVDAAPGDYISAKQWLTKEIAKKMKKEDQLNGIGFWDSSADGLNLPCTEDQRTYGSLVRDLFRQGNTATCTLRTEPWNGGSNDTRGIIDSAAQNQAPLCLIVFALFVVLLF